jgi:hypothetical protein
MKDPLYGNIGQQVDAKSDEMFKQFLEHERECLAKNPEMTDRGTLMQAWMLQKIAGLHCLTLDLVRRICELERSQKR